MTITDEVQTVDNGRNPIIQKWGKHEYFEFDRSKIGRFEWNETVLFTRLKNPTRDAFLHAWSNFFFNFLGLDFTIENGSILIV